MNLLYGCNSDSGFNYKYEMMYLFMTYAVVLISLLYSFINQLAIKVTPFYTKVLITMAWFTSISVLVILNIDVYQSVNNTVMIELTNFWRFFYWSSFIFGYIVFVILSEYDRQGSGKSLFEIWVDYYRQRLPIFISVFLSIVLFLIYLLMNGILDT